MSQDIPNAEVQLCVAAKNIRRPSFTYDDLRAFGTMVFKDKLEEWSSAFERLCQHNVFRAEGERYSLTRREGR